MKLSVIIFCLYWTKIELFRPAGASFSRYLIPKGTYVQAERNGSIFEDFHGFSVKLPIQFILFNFCHFKIENPYAYLENPDDPKTINFVDSLNNISLNYFDQCPIKDKINKGYFKYILKKH